MTTPALPPGFEMDAPPALPPGFELDAPQAPVEFKGGKAQIPGPVAGMQAPERTAAPVPELRGMSLSRQVLGGLEAALSVVTGLTGGSVGMAGGLVEGLAKIVKNGKFGTAAGANEVEATMAQRSGDLTYQPRSDAGQAIMHDFVAPVGAALAPLTGHGGELGMLQATASPAKAAGMQAGRETKAAVGNAGLDAAAGMVKLNPQKLENAAAAIDAGMDVPLHAVGDRGPIVQGAGEALGHLPASGSKVDSNVRAFNRKVIEHINPEESAQTLTPKVMDRALKTAGKTIGENMRAIEVPHTDLVSALNDIRTGLDTATTDAKSVVSGYLGQIEAKALEHDGKIPGAALRELDTKLGEQLRSMSGKHPDIENRLADLQEAIRDAAEARMTPEQAQATQSARQRYAKTMSLVPAYADIRTQGYLEPGKLMDLVGKSPLSKRLMATGNGGAWQDLAAAGELVAPKGAMTRGRVIGGSVGLGAGGVYLGTTGAMSPVGAAAAGGGLLGAANVYNRVGPKVVRKLVERERKRNAPPPEAPPPELTTEPGAGGPGPAPRGGTVLPAPDDGPLGPAGPELTTSPGAGGVELPRELSPAEQALAARAPVLDELTIGERAPSRIIKGRRGEVERRAMKDVPAVPGRPDMPEQMNVGAPAEVGRTAADNAALIEDQTVLAREKQGLSLAPGKEAPPPVGEAKEVGTYDPRLAEIERLRAQTDNPAVRGALAKRETEVKKAMKAEDAARKRDADAAALEDAIRKTEDPEIKATLRAEADKLREKIPTPEVKEGMPADKPEKVGKIPVGKTKEGDVEPVPAAPRPKLAEPEVTEIAPEVVEGGEPIPRGEATEVEPVPVGQADEMLPVGEAAEVLPVGEVSEILPAADVIEGPPPMDRVPMPPAPKPRMIERGRTVEPPHAQAAAGPAVKRVKGGPLEGSWLEVTLPDGTVKKMQRTNNPLASEVGGWHDITEPGKQAGTWIGDTQAEALAELTRRHGRAVEAKVAKDHGLGTKDMERAKAVAAALEKDESAVVAATTKGHTPAAFDAEIERINRSEQVETVSGLNLRRVNTRDGMRWEVQNPENIGTDKVLGNRLFESREAAEGEAPRMVAEHAERVERRAASAAAEAARKAEADARRAKNAGKTLMQMRADKLLDEGLIRHDGVVKSKRKMVDDILDAGGKPSTFEEDRIKPMSRTAFNRASNAEQRAHDAKVKAGGKVTRYMVGESQVDKVQYDYAQEKLNATQTPKATASEPRGQDAQARTEQPRPDGAATARADGGKAPEAVSKTVVSDPPTMRYRVQERGGSTYLVPMVGEAFDQATRRGLRDWADSNGYFASVIDDNRVSVSAKTGGPALDLLPNGAEELKYGRIAEKERAQNASQPTEALTTVKSLLQPAPRKAIAPTDPKPLIARKNSEILADLNKQIDERLQRAVNERADAVGKVTFKSGGTTYTVVNTRERLQALKDEINKSPAFKDKAQAKAPISRELGFAAFGRLRDDKTHASALNKRAPKTVVADMVAEGDFENASVLAEHYGVDIKAGMDAKQKRAYQDWQDGPKPEPALPKAPEPVPQPPKAAPEPVQATHPDPAANMAFDEWAKHQYSANEYKDSYLRRAGGDEKRAALMATVSGGSKEMPIKDLLAQAKQRYAQRLLELPRDATISLDVYDALPPMLQTEAARHFFDIDTRLTKRTQNEVAARMKGQEAAEAPIRQRLVDVDAEIERLDSRDGPDTQKVKDLRLKRAKLEQEMYEMRRLY